MRSAGSPLYDLAGMEMIGEPPCYLDEFTHEWALNHRPFLAMVFAEFDRDADWPQVNVLQRRLIRRGERLNVTEAAFNLPPNLGRLESLSVPGSPHEQQIALSLFALRYVDDAHTLLDSFSKFLRLVVDRYVSAGDEDEVVARRADLSGLGLPETEVTKLSHVILRGGIHFLAGGVSDIAGWERTIHEPGLVPLLDVHDIDGYLGIEGAFLSRRPSFSTPAASFASAVPPEDLRTDLHPAIREGW